MSDVSAIPTMQVHAPFFCERKPFVKPTAVLFDLDDTLINSKALMIPVGKALKAQMEGAGEGTCPGFKTGAPHMDYFKCRLLDLPLGYELTQYYFELLVEKLKEHLPSVLKPKLLDVPSDDLSHIYRFKGALQTLQYLIDQHIPVAIVTNSPQALIDVSLPQIFPELYKDGKTPAYFVVVGVTERDEGKPSLDTTTRALEALHIPVINGKVDPSVYFVGDSHAHDVKVGHAMGMTNILLSDVGMKEGDPKRPSLIPLMHDNRISPINAHLQNLLYADNHEKLQGLFECSMKSPPALAASR